MGSLEPFPKLTESEFSEMKLKDLYIFGKLLVDSAGASVQHVRGN